MADYGLQVSNNSNSVIIDSLYKVMVFSERGNFRIQSQYTDKEGGGSVTFSKVITTQEPPQIFVGNISGAHPNLGLYTTLLGGPGNWTGFAVTSAVRGGSTLQNYYVEYVACKYADKGNTEPYGMHIWDGSSNIVYASQDRPVRYSKFAKTWRFNTGTQVFIFDSDLPLDSDDFICISAFDRGVTWCTGFSYTGLTILDNSAPVLRINATIPGGGYGYPYGANTNFCVPVCKFPADRYHN